MKKILLSLALLTAASWAMAQTANYPEVQLTPAYAADSGAANVLVATVNYCPSAYTTGMLIKVLPNHANSTTTPTLNFCAIGAKTITKAGQSALAANDLLTTAIAVFVYDGTYMELQNPQTLAGAVTSVSGTGIISNSSSTGGVTITWTGTSGGVPYFASGTTTGSSGALTQYGVVLGGGAAAAPQVTAAGSLNMPLIGQGAANPVFSSIAYVTSCGTGYTVYSSSGTALACNSNLVQTSGGIFTTYDGISTAGLGLDVVEAVSDTLASSTSLTTTNLVASTGAAGFYRVHIYMDLNTVCTTVPGNVYATVNWTDASNARSATTVPLTMTTAQSATTGYINADIPLYSATASAISFTTTYAGCGTGTGKYDIHATLFRSN